MPRLSDLIRSNGPLGGGDLDAPQVEREKSSAAAAGDEPAEGGTDPRPGAPTPEAPSTGAAAEAAPPVPAEPDREEAPAAKPPPAPRAAPPGESRPERRRERETPDEGGTGEAPAAAAGAALPAGDAGREASGASEAPAASEAAAVPEPRATAPAPEPLPHGDPGPAASGEAAAPVEPAPAAGAPAAPEPGPGSALGDRYDRLVAEVAASFEAAAAGQALPESLFEEAERLIADPAGLDALYLESLRRRHEEDSWGREGANVGIYALRLARAARTEPAMLPNLTVAGLLHKIGFARLPPALATQTGRLGWVGRRRIRRHPGLARDCLQASGGGFPAVAEIVYQVHERRDGTGYPGGCRGNEIREEGSVVGLADVYEAMIQRRPWRPRITPFEAVSRILSAERERFPRRVLRGLLEAFAVFPPGSFVRLNSGATARIDENEPENPLRPVVTVVAAPDGSPVEPRRVRLRDEPLLFIVEPVDDAAPAQGSSRSYARGSSLDS